MTGTGIRAEDLGAAVAAFRKAMIAEHVHEVVIGRILNRVVFGDPDGPEARHEIHECGHATVTIPESRPPGRGGTSGGIVITVDQPRPAVRVVPVPVIAEAYLAWPARSYRA